MTTMAQPTGGSVTEEIEWIINRPGVSVAPECAAIEKYNLTARAKFQGMITPGTRGATGTLTYTLEQFDGGSGTVVLTTMLISAASWDFDTSPYSQMQDFQYQGSSLAPITVSM